VNQDRDRSRRAAGGARRLTAIVGVATAAVLAASLVLGVAGALGPLARAADPSSPASPGGKIVLRLGITEDADNLNPFIGFSETSYELWSQNYEFLVERRPQDFGPGPDGIAQSWEHSADGLTWTFHLHHGITWQDGQPLTADDVVFTYNYILKAKGSGLNGTISGITKAVKVDDYTVQLITSAPKSNITRLWIPILPKHIWEKIPPEEATSTYKNPPPIVGSGPFQITAWKPGSYIMLKANKDYWQGAPVVDEVIFQIYTNPGTMVEDLRSGVLAAANGVPEAQFKQLQSTKGITAVPYICFNWDYICYNSYDNAASMGNPALRDPRFRVALDYAIDRDKLCQIAYHGLAEPGTTILPPDQWADPDYHWEPPADVLRTYDPAKAKALLDAAGYTDTNGDGIRDYKGKPITLRLWALQSLAQQQSAAKLITGWFQDLGLRIKLEVVDEGYLNDHIWNYKGNTLAPDFDMYLWYWMGFADPGQTLDAFTTAQVGNWNEPGYSSHEFDRYENLQAEALDPQKRAEYVWKCQEVMYTDCPESAITYSKMLQALDTGHWTGWIHTGVNDSAMMFFSEATPKEFLTVRPATSGANGSRAWLLALAGAAVVAVVATVLVVVVRWRPRAEESS
jgi:peptide/nickel transport system substrate-binding protein